MKAILTSIRPQHVANILNLLKLWEIRKKFPKDYVGWVYIYCTKDKQLTLRNERYILINGEKYHIDSPIFNGKVVARFWCDKVEGAYNFYEEELCQLACITEEELCKYAGGRYKTDDLLAIHITKLEIFDKPKELSEFYKLGAWKVYEEQFDSSYLKRIEQEIMKSLGQTLNRAPQSWCYIED